MLSLKKMTFKGVNNYMKNENKKEKIILDDRNKQDLYNQN